MCGITPNKPTTANTTTLSDDVFTQVSRALQGGATGPEPLTLLLRLVTTHFDRVNTREGYTRLHRFRVCTGTHVCDLSPEFRVLVSVVRGSESVWPVG